MDSQNKLQTPRWSRAPGHLVALALPFAALGLQLWIEPLAPQTSYQLFLGAVALSALYGGLEDGLLTLFVSGLGRFYLFESPRLSFAEGHPAITLRLVLFVALGIMVAWLVGKLRSAQGQLAATLSSIGDAVAIADNKGRLTFLNPMAESVSGYKLAESKGKPLGEVIHFLDEDTRQPVDNPALKVRQTGVAVTYTHPAILLCSGGREVPVEDSAAPIRDTTGKVHGAVLVFRDISPRLRLEEQLRHAQKMDALGRLAGGVAHDFNNVLTVIAGHVDFLAETAAFASDTAAKESIDTIRKNLENAGQLTRQLMVFSRKQPVARRLVNLNEVVGGLDRILRNLLGKSIGLDLTLEARLGRVVADASQMQQIILNLASNARDAMPGGGKLTIRTYNVLPDRSSAPWSEASQSEPYVALEVADNGTGMDESTKSKIFEPFFTTKPAGKGTGLGLSIVYGIVQQSGGYVAVNSRAGEGSKFTIFLPRSDGTERDLAKRDSCPAGNSAAPCILLAEDCESLRKLLVLALHTNGYTVLAARNGAEAIRIAADEINRIDLVVTDLAMPIMGGVELVNGLHVLRPELNVIYMSGSEVMPVCRNAGAPREIALPKPFSISSLLAAVNELLPVSIVHNVSEDGRVPVGR